MRDSSWTKAIIILISFLGCLFYLGLCGGVHKTPALSFFCYIFAHAFLHLWVFRIGPDLNVPKPFRNNTRRNAVDDYDQGNTAPSDSRPAIIKDESNHRSSAEKKMWEEFLFSTTGILIISVVLRIAFISYPLSDDVNRYAWEGLIQNSGINPYLRSPEEFSAEFTYDPIYHGINHKNSPTIYPPLSLLIFRGISSVIYTIHWPPSTVLFAYKTFFIICDLLVVIVLAQLLKAWRKNPYWLTLYAWNPLVILYGSGEGHIDILQNVFIALTLLHFSKYRASFIAGFFFLGCAVMSKYLSIILLPFVITRENRRKFMDIFHSIFFLSSLLES